MANTNNQNSFLDYAGLALFWNNVKTIIEDNELVTATALTNLDTRVNTLEEEAVVQIISKTYSELKALRDNSQLVPGQQYRITDYTCTTTQTNTKSAWHVFDIIVTADDESTLNEVARAVKHEGDSYFNECDLNVWKLWYSLDNDTKRFAWADSVNGKGVIYRMVDEWNNDVPYDFKNIIYVVVPYFMYNQWGDTYLFRRDVSIDISIDGIQYYGYISESTPPAWSENKCWIKEESPTISSKLYKRDGSEIRFGQIQRINLDNYETYTFGRKTDLSKSGNCYNNIILAYYKSNTLTLNKIIFSSDCYNNTFGSSCYSNSFGNKCHNNSFGNYCGSNTFGDLCSDNSFGNGCDSNTFGADCSRNTFGGLCSYNSFLSTCYSNTVGNGCRNNTFGINCGSNTFGNDCDNNTFGNDCSNNSFGNYCTNNSFGNACSSNSFGNECSHNSFRAIGDITGSNISNCRYNAFDDGCSYNIIYSANTSDSAYLENYHINRGVKGTSNKYMLIDAQYLNSENVCNVYRKGDVAIVSYIQY